MPAAARIGLLSNGRACLHPTFSTRLIDLGARELAGGSGFDPVNERLELPALLSSATG